VIRIRLFIPGVDSLKEKRRVLKSLLTKLQNDFNASVAEVGDNDVYRSALIGIALVSNSTKFVHQMGSKIIQRIEATPTVEITEYVTETY